MKERNPIIIWQDPPKRRSQRRHPLEAELLALRERPGAWARIATREDAAVARRLAHGIRHNGSVRRLGRFEAKAREIEPGSFGVWARYMGPAEELS